ncbi:hypothetical protein ACIA5H_34710 [Nocardia sp. NPDC051900]|uniref:hypothetical protein n=1 Tax=Nocardia sp. NPDC051900 TaxID=3364326 RepID=UPI0037AFA66B
MAGAAGHDLQHAVTQLPLKTEIPAQAAEAPELVFAYLAAAIAAHPRMRVIDPATNKARRTRKLTRKPPSWPAAVPIYNLVRLTSMLVFDFDSKRHGAAAVSRDVAKLKAWLAAVGGRWISDHNPGNGGRHVIVFLAEGEAFRKVNIEPVMRLLKSRLPTLDLSPMLNETQGFITPPGSATKEGCSRILDGSLAAALEACAVRSEPGLVARMRLLLGDSLAPTIPLAPRPAAESTEHHPDVDLWEGSESARRLRPEWRLTSPMPAVPAAFAVHGTLPPDNRYPTRSEGCQSVLQHSALRGLCLDDVQTRIYATGDDAWAGLRAWYDEHGTRADAHLRHDWGNACQWTSAHIHLLRSSGHSEGVGRTPPSGGSLATRETPHSRWLTSAIAWVHLNFPGQSYRWTVIAVLQALAYAAYLQGDIGGDGTALAGVGIRSLSLHAGLMPKTTIADVLAHIRELPGAPIDLVRTHAGTAADRYSLVPARRYDDLDDEVNPLPLERVRVEGVHDAWRVLGLHKRALYELITHTGLTTRAELLAAAHTSPSTGDDILAALKRDGLIISSGRGTYGPGPVTLDDIAVRHGLPDERARLLALYSRERTEWRTWLEMRHGVEDTAAPPAAPWDTDNELSEAIWAAQMASGAPEWHLSLPEDPDLGPEHDDDAVALALLRDQLGAILLD